MATCVSVESGYTPRDLHALLLKGLQDAQALLDLLRREQGFLSQREMMSLTEAVQQKQKLTQGLHLLAHEYQKILPCLLRLPDEKISNSQTFGNHQDILLLQEQLKSLVQECRRQNAQNAALLEVMRRYMQRAIDILVGSPPGEAVYNPQGETRRLTAARYRSSV
jgi:flagellar biosynthesis/type III secretory pathway chaperone